MNKSKIAIVSLLIIIVILCVFLYTRSVKTPQSNTNISSGESQSTESTGFSIIHDEKYGGAYIKISADEFNSLGFQYGDSVDVVFTNGYKFEDIPYYNGYYTDVGEPLLVAYPSNQYIRVGINYGDDIWVLGNLNDNEKCTINLREKAKYADIQMLRNISYSNDQGDLPDEVFGNFRPMNLGNLKENTLYRGASPIDNTNKRAGVVDRLISGEKIAYIIDLADNDDEIMSFSQADDFNSPYFMDLYNNHKISVLSMNIQYKTDNFSQKLAQGLSDMAQNDGPYYIHCQEGKDRTGFVCIALEAFAGATYQEIVDDYMKTYENYYKITQDSDKERYEVIKEKNVDTMLRYIVGAEESDDLSTIDLKTAARVYLQNIGMSDETINLLESKICK